MPRKKTTAELVGERAAAFAKAMASQGRTPICVIADNIRSLDNVGLLFRLCELIRARHLYLTGYTGRPGQSEKHDRRIGKTSVYAVPHQPWSHHDDAITIVEDLKASGHKILALEQTDNSIPYHKLQVAHYSLPICLILGHEREGVHPELLKIADHVIEIPILGLGNSHNVAIAAGIVLYHLLEKTGQLV